MAPIRWLCRLHDALTDAGYVVGTTGLFALVAIYCYEVLTRYFLGLATDWANDTFANVLCVTIFAIVPHATRRGLHISVSLLPDTVPRLQRPLGVVSAIVGFAACLFVAWMSLEANIRQVVLQIVTEQNRPIPKIYMSGFITFGFFLAAFYFLRSLFAHEAVAPRSWVAPARIQVPTVG